MLLEISLNCRIVDQFIIVYVKILNVSLILIPLYRQQYRRVEPLSVEELEAIFAEDTGTMLTGSELSCYLAVTIVTFFLP